MTTIHEYLSAGIIRLKFTKVDGTIREMVATTNRAIIAARLPAQEPKEDKPRKPSPVNVFRVLDVEKNEFRSFREDRLLEWTMFTENSNA